ncbi:questin oxidase family protein [Enterovibrio sp. ZSDZ35]|uniref:Questin oxidase family protein n=1 Tax=Enterovibrio qingdaonensis TaxID=2899818 RepID=A0ABT5QJG4_9GAMM|nr:questin oxidase family protein [Enterovibrio sp. ZSDZ35]MDD1781122.1 questin oxidase family protein [Enterovibrio sp. ZSDZ35]
MLFSTKNTERRFNAAADMSALVNDEMQRDSAFHPNLGGITQGGMSNHYPMTIMSLQGLGANDDEVKAFRSTWPRYRARIEEDLNFKDTGEVTEDNWTTYLGQSQYLADFQRLFFDGLNGANDQTDYLMQVLDKLQYALPMGLFHPVIRLSFALMHGDKGLIADALAYWAIRFEDMYQRVLPPRTDLATLSISAEDMWQKVHAAKPQVTRFGGSLRICEILCSDPVLQDLAIADAFFITEENIELKIREIGDRAISLYLHEPALTTLHAVTSYQALADITLRVLSDGNAHRLLLAELWQRYWIWLTGLYIEKGFPKAFPKLSDDSLDDVQIALWEDIASGICKVPEVHAIKMVYSCKWLYEHIDANPLFKAAAINVLSEHTNVKPVRLIG